MRISQPLYAALVAFRDHGNPYAFDEKEWVGPNRRYRREEAVQDALKLGLISIRENCVTQKGFDAITEHEAQLLSASADNQPTNTTGADAPAVPTKDT